MEFHGFHYFSNSHLFSKARLMQLATRLNIEHADRIRVLSAGMRERFLNMYGSHLENRLVVLPPRVDLSLFGGARSTIPNEVPVVAMVGTVNNNKGQLRFLKTFLRSGLKGQVWVIGDGPELLQCKAFATQTGAAERVKFFGRVTHERLSVLLNNADVFLQFSAHEGTPRALMEAMAAGLPVISTDAGFCRDVFRHGKDGFLLGTNPSEEVVECLRQLFADPRRRILMGASAKEHATQEFDAKVLFDRYRTLLRETALC